jgi:hypothetical protein
VYSTPTNLEVDVKQLIETADDFPNLTTSRGIDYSHGRSNWDRETGTHFGVISVNACSEWIWESFESDYGEPTCPQCSGKAVDYDDELHGSFEHFDQEYGAGGDYACANCKILLDAEDVYPEEPVGHAMVDDEYRAIIDSNNDVFVLKSPYYTYCQFCSPCAPGAGHLEHPCFIFVQLRFPRSRKRRIRRKWKKQMKNHGLFPLGVKTYCLGHDFFNNDKAPYPVFAVKTGQRVLPE